MTLKACLTLSCLALTVAAPVNAQTSPVPNWPFPSAPNLQDPRTQDFMRWMEMMRPYAQQTPGWGTGPAIPVPPITGDIPTGTAQDFADMMLRLRQPAPMPSMVDQNHDRTVSDEEAAAHAEAIFVALDSDGDRALSPDEIERRTFVVMFAQPQTEEPEPSDRFTALDGNADGTVSKAEFLDVARAHYEASRDPVTDTVTPWSYRRTDWF